MQGIFLREYGVAATIPLELFEVDGVDFRVDAVAATGDIKITKDEAEEANTDNLFVDEGNKYSLLLTAIEMQAERISGSIIDATATKVWLDTGFEIETYGNSSAQHAVNLNDSVRAGLTALPNAAADAAGGLPISDVGGLDLDAMNTNINDIEADTADMQPKLGTPSSSLAADIAANATPAEVGIEISDFFVTDTFAEPSSIPAATSSLKDKIGLIFTMIRNKLLQTSTLSTLRNDADSADIGTSVVSDDTTIFTRNEWI